MINLFISYSHKDEDLRVELDKHLSLLRRNGVIDAWHDRRIVPGEDFLRSINRHLKEANIILLLVSADFLDSDYCYEREMQEAMRMHELGEAAVIPVILRHCDWQEAPFGKLLALPKDGKPVSSFRDKDESFLEITNGIKSSIRALHGKPKNHHEQNAADKDAAGVSTPFITRPRSTNLTLKQDFSDFEKDKFLRETFAFMASYFETSLSELEKNNPGIRGLFERVDSQTFTATIYRDGKKVSECMIYTGAPLLSKNINFSYQISSLRNSFNESVSVVDNGYMLLFKSLKMSTFRAMNDGEITGEFAAEFYWQMLIQRLQR